VSTVRELRLIRSGKLEWCDREPPRLEGDEDAIVRPFLAARCDGDTLPIHRHVSRATSSWSPGRSPAGAVPVASVA
jgi:hypothetical protein